MSGSRPPRRARAARLLGVAVVLAVAGGALLGWLYHTGIVADPGPVTREGIRAIIVQDSPVYYRDGTTRVGVFFDDEHRDHVPFARLPRAYVAALVAAEDDGFWTHWGLEPIHIARAMKDNLVAGTLVAGGSTLTQQTAKNLFYRPDRSVRSKLLEARNALRLEAHFDKQEILEFYANQFHVSGNGRGVGIAARYFFDRDVAKLGVAENAFLAGLVKGPRNYDPFHGDADRRARARERAHDRTTYVLRRLVEEPAGRLAGPMPGRGEDDAAAYAARVAEVRAVQAEAAQLLEQGFELPFQRGTFRFASNAVLDEVARRLGEAPFPEVLARAGISDPETAGLQVVTTLDPEAQRAATYGLWHHLTEAGALLEAEDVTDFVLPETDAPRFDPEHGPQVGQFRTATVVEQVADDQGRAELIVDLGGATCRVVRDAIVRAAVAARRGALGDPTARIATADVDAFATGLADAVVRVSVRAVDDDGATCDLERQPDLQGAVMVVRDGEVLAMVGGNDNKDFNRATALRQMGSTWKPIVLHAALQLGWTTTDVLDNREGVFPFSTTFYTPRPDHDPVDEVSLAWAGVKSENLASIWLLYHLTDRLGTAEAVDLAGRLGLLRDEGEAEEAYRLRIQKAGVLPTPTRLQEGFYLRARHEVVDNGLPYPEDAVALTSLPYGWGFDAERRRAGGTSGAYLDRAWRTVDARATRCAAAVAQLHALWSVGIAPTDGAWPGVWGRRTGDRIDVSCEAPEPAPDTPPVDPGDGVVGRDPAAIPTWRPIGADLFAPDLMGTPPVLAPIEATRVAGLHLGTVDLLRETMKRLELERSVDGAPDLYAPEVLVWHQDFRVLMSLRYVTRLAAAYGVRTELQEVLSLPLGASEATLEDMTMVYEGLSTGKTWHFPGTARGPLGRTEVSEPAASTLLIAEIRDVDGRVLYRARPTAEAVGDEAVGALTTDILRHVVSHGTGRRAEGHAVLGEAPLPLAGKTGTTNDFRNAAFVGVVPTVDHLDVVGRIAVGVYVGYDDNRPMTARRARLAGASGALPAWLGTIQGLAARGVLGPREAVAPADGWRWPVPDALTRVAVDTTAGLPVDGGGAEILTRPAAEAPDEVAAIEAAPREVRIAPRTDGTTPRQERGVWGRLLPELPDGEGE